MEGYEVLKHTVRIPLEWDVDARLLWDMVGIRLEDIDAKLAN